MAEAYTPTTWDIREHVAWQFDAGSKEETDVFEAFDRWLAEHDRAISERAWNELYVTQFDGAPFEMSDTTGITDPNNPYREEAGRG